MNSRAQAVLDFWFGEIEESEDYLKQRTKLWFGGTPEIDNSVKQNFERDVALAASGELNSWEDNCDSCLALVILLDQFSLNIYRGQPRAFLQSEMAIPIVLRALDKAVDQQLHPLERVFLYLPLEHSENIEDQTLSLHLFARLADRAPIWLREAMKSYLDYARRHYNVVKRFGRFPYRNMIFGRPPTLEETKYISDGGPKF